MTKLEETNDLIISYDNCILPATAEVLFDIAKSLAIIVDKLCEADVNDKTAEEADKEKKNDTKDESSSKAEETLNIIGNIIFNNDAEDAYKIARIHDILSGYYIDRVKSDS